MQDAQEPTILSDQLTSSVPNSEQPVSEDTPEVQRALKYKCRQLQKRVRYLGAKLGAMR